MNFFHDLGQPALRPSRQPSKQPSTQPSRKPYRMPSGSLLPYRHTIAMNSIILSMQGNLP